jgi:hypothetical protein
MPFVSRTACGDAARVHPMSPLVRHWRVFSLSISGPAYVSVYDVAFLASTLVAFEVNLPSLA